MIALNKQFAYERAVDTVCKIAVSDSGIFQPEKLLKDLDKVHQHFIQPVGEAYVLQEGIKGSFLSETPSVVLNIKKVIIQSASFKR